MRYAISILQGLHLMHICGWERSQTTLHEMWVPRFRLGNGKDVVAPLARLRLITQPPKKVKVNPAVALQAVTLAWGASSMKEAGNGLLDLESEELVEHPRHMG